MINYPDFFRQARMLETFARDEAGLSPEQAHEFGLRHAAAPVPRAQVARMRALVQARRDAQLPTPQFQVAPGADKFVWDTWAPVKSGDDE